MFERTKTMWRRLLGQPGPEAGGTTAIGEDDRRASERYATDIPTTYKLAGAPDSERYTASVRNLSLGGINLLGECDFKPGEMISLDLPRAGKNRPNSILACVVHCAAEKEGKWSLGCTFSRELGDEDLEAFGARRELADAADKRHWKRFQTSITSNFQLAATDDPHLYPARVLDVSASGVGLLCDRFVENGSLLSVELHNARGTTERTMLACIVHVMQQTDGKWALGCNFIRSLSEEDLGALV
jgi:hypothetical protein